MSIHKASKFYLALNQGQTTIQGLALMAMAFINGLAYSSHPTSIRSWATFKTGIYSKKYYTTKLSIC